MESIKEISDFKHFMQMNREKIYASAENADDISLDDEWMQENQWDEIYKQGGNKNEQTCRKSDGIKKQCTNGI